MAHISKNAPLGKGCASMKSGVQLGGIEHQTYTENLTDMQAHWLCRRALISTPMARVMAELHFGGAA